MSCLYTMTPAFRAVRWLMLLTSSVLNNTQHQPPPKKKTLCGRQGKKEDKANKRAPTKLKLLVADCYILEGKPNKGIIWFQKWISLHLFANFAGPYP